MYAPIIHVTSVLFICQVNQCCKYQGQCAKFGNIIPAIKLKIHLDASQRSNFVQYRQTVLRSVTITIPKFNSHNFLTFCTPHKTSICHSFFFIKMADPMYMYMYISQHGVIPFSVLTVFLHAHSKLMVIIHYTCHLCT